MTCPANSNYKIRLAILLFDGKLTWRRAWQPTPVFLSENLMDQGAWRATVCRSAQSQTQLRWLSTHYYLIKYTSKWEVSPKINNFGMKKVSVPQEHIITINTYILNEKVKSKLSPNLCNPTVYSPWNSPGQNTGVGSLCLLQRIFPTQGSDPGLPHCKRVLYQLSHKGRPRILVWVAYPLASRSSWPRNQTRVSFIVGRYLPTELSGKSLCTE